MEYLKYNFKGLIKTKISYRLDDPIQKYDFNNRGKELSKNKASRNKKILS